MAGLVWSEVSTSSTGRSHRQITGSVSAHRSLHHRLVHARYRYGLVVYFSALAPPFYLEQSGP